MNKMIERVARAIFFAQWNIMHDHEQIWNEQKKLKGQLWDEISRAAFEAMREPTEEMLNYKVWLTGFDGKSSALSSVRRLLKSSGIDSMRKEIWQAMIDAALAKGKPKTYGSLTQPSSKGSKTKQTVKTTPKI